MGKGKLFKAAATIAAIGGVCYVFRDKIKNSTVYQSLDMDDKVEKVKSTIKEKMPVKEEADRDYFSLDDATETDPAAAQTNAPVQDTAAPSETVSDETAVAEDTVSEAASEADPASADESEEASDDTPILYENEGLSDVSEDLDVIEEQDKLDV